MPRAQAHGAVWPREPSALIVVYEYPFHESIRTMLRLEQLFGRLDLLRSRDQAVDHHFALATLFEIMDVAARADLKSDLLLDLDRQRTQLAAYRGNPSISEAVLDAAISSINTAWQALNALPGKVGQSLTTNEGLMSIRSRISIPGGTCSFDLPGYHAWQQGPVDQRKADLERWIAGFTPLWHALRVSLGLLREAGSPQTITTRNGQHQQTLGGGRSYQLLRVAIDDSAGLVPEISGNRLLVAIRLMRPDADGRLRPAGEDSSLVLTLCA
jgi:cell division protein ZapD